MEKQRILIWAGIALAILVGCITYYNLQGKNQPQN